MSIRIDSYICECDYKDCKATIFEYGDQHDLDEHSRIKIIEDIYPNWQIIKDGSGDFRQWTVYCPIHARIMEKIEEDSFKDEIGQSQGTDSEE